LAIPTLETYITGLEKFFYIQMVFRSVENRIPTVKADGAFSASIIDPYGRILAKRSGAPEGEAFALVADVPVVESGTLYTHVGDWMGWLSIAGMVVFMVLPGILKKGQGKKDVDQS
jgi:apolipoprotein N-acyltransferase